MVSTWQNKYMVSSLSAEFQEKLGTKTETPLIKYYKVWIFVSKIFVKIGNFLGSSKQY